MSGHSKVTVVGIFSSDSSANYALQIIREPGHSPPDVTLIAPRADKPVEISQQIEPSRFSDEQIARYNREIELGRALLMVESEHHSDELARLLSENGAVEVDVAEFVHDERTHHTLPLYEEELRSETETRKVGEAIIRKVVEEVPAQAKVEAIHEELDIEHVQVGEAVDERRSPWREGDVLVIPVYEEQIRVVRQLVMREQLRIRLHQVSETHTVDDTVRREHAVVEDPDNTQRINVRHQAARPEETPSESNQSDA